MDYNPELSNREINEAHENQLLNEMFGQEEDISITYAYPILLRGDTYSGINKNGFLYVVKHDQMKPEEAIERMKFKNLKTQYSKDLTDDDRVELSKCHKFVADYTIKNILSNYNQFSNEGRK